jgi:hypothetical protein
MPKVLTNGRDEIKSEDFRRIVQQLIDAGSISPGILAGDVQPDPRQGGRHAAHVNGAAPIWSHETVVKAPSLGQRFSAAAQAVRGMAGRLYSGSRLYGSQVARASLSYFQGSKERGSLWVDAVSGSIIAVGFIAAVVWRML